MSEKLNKVIAIIVVLIVVGIGVLFLLKNSIHCELNESLPEYNATDLMSKIKTSDNKVLVQYSGYLKYEKKVDDKEAKKVYLPLDFLSIRQENRGNQSSSTGSLIMEANCAKVTYNLFTNGKQQQGVKSIQIDLTLANGQYSSCIIEDPAIMLVDANQHYKCAIRSQFNCYAQTKDSTGRQTVAKYILNYLEYQVDGNPDKIKNFQFSNEAGKFC